MPHNLCPFQQQGRMASVKTNALAIAAQPPYPYFYGLSLWQS